MINFCNSELSTCLSEAEKRREQIVDNLILTHDLWELSPDIVQLVTELIVLLLKSPSLTE